MIRRWLALTYYLYALRLAALSHFYFNPLYLRYCFELYVDLRFCQGLCMPSVGRYADEKRNRSVGCGTPVFAAYGY